MGVKDYNADRWVYCPREKHRTSPSASLADTALPPPPVSLWCEDK